MQIILSDCLIWSVSAVIYWSGEGVCVYVRVWVSGMCAPVCLCICAHALLLPNCRLTHFHELSVSLTHTHTHKYFVLTASTHTQIHMHDRWLGHISLCWVFKGIKLFTHIELISNSLHSIKPELTVKTAKSIPSQFTPDIPADTSGLHLQQLPVQDVYLISVWRKLKKVGFVILQAFPPDLLLSALTPFWCELSLVF